MHAGVEQSNEAHPSGGPYGRGTGCRGDQLAEAIGVTDRVPRTGFDLNRLEATLRDQIRTRLASIDGGLGETVTRLWVDDYRPCYVYLAVAGSEAIESAVALQFLHQYVQTRRDGIGAAGDSNLTRTDVILTGDLLLAKAFETVGAVQPTTDTHRLYERFVTASRCVTTALTENDTAGVVELYASAADIAGVVATDDAPDRRRLRNVGEVVGGALHSSDESASYDAVEKLDAILADTPTLRHRLDAVLLARRPE